MIGNCESERIQYNKIFFYLSMVEQNAIKMALSVEFVLDLLGGCKASVNRLNKPKGGEVFLFDTCGGIYIVGCITDFIGAARTCCTLSYLPRGCGSLPNAEGSPAGRRCKSPILKLRPALQVMG